MPETSAAKSPRILIVEDCIEIRENIALFLEAKGYVTAEAENGPKGLASAEAGGVDLVVLDLGLPGMDGIDVCRRLRSEGFRVPILILTARDELDEKLEGLASGASGYILKPFGLRELEGRIRAALDRRGACAATRTPAPGTPPPEADRGL